jgi:xylan 1,4-beta-xylosidase
MVTYQGIVKPTFRAYRFLHELGDELLARTEGAVIARDRSTGKLTALCYHYPAEVPQSAPASFDTPDVAQRTLAMGSPAIVELRLTGLRESASFVVEVPDGEHGNAVAAWNRLGSPTSPSRHQLNLLRDVATQLRNRRIESMRAAI